MRQRISTQTKHWKFPPLVIAVLLFITMIKIYTENSKDYIAFIVISLVILVCIGLYFYFDKAKTISYDNVNLYITNKYSEETIPLNQITKIKKSLMEINDRDVWVIRYLDRHKMTKSIKVWPRWNSNYFENFKTSVAEIIKTDIK